MSDDRIFVRFRGRTLGPFTKAKAVELVRRGKISRMHELSADGLNWIKAEEFGDLFGSSPAETPVARAPVQDASEPVSSAAGQSSAIPVSRVNPAAPAEPSVDWYANIDGENQGPVKLQELRRWAETGLIHSTTLVWRAGLDEWQRCDRVLPDWFASLNPAQSPATNANIQISANRPATTGSSGADLAALSNEWNRNRAWAFLFAIFLIVFPSLQILGHMIQSVLVLSQPEGERVATPVILAGLFGTAWSATFITAGILLIRYCGSLKSFSRAQSQSRALFVSRRLSVLWAFIGISSMVWVVIGTSVFLVFMSAILSIIGAAS